MTRRGFLSSIAAVMASPRSATDVAAAAAVVGEARNQIATTDAKFVAAVEAALFGYGAGNAGGLTCDTKTSPS